ncbi:hypothetical protein FBT96_03510 [Rhodobacter capsulatus]|uniref:5-bromo-4-chloroindolyl phosphate hydrolysis protein n=1 Tax=Rhodobacter capsulatus TaxID=1061 RepID=A0A4U1K1F2_RHOCA|nr:hypothetical protein [Rhodobacter capsulatus]TKD25068.1 hypothetical protein FBT96_03510 [Rhodobacter capsulatus]
MVQTAVPLPVLAAALGLGALQAQAATGAASQALAPLTETPWGGFGGLAALCVTPLALAAVLCHRRLIGHLHAATVQLSIRASGLRRSPGPRQPLAPAKQLAEGGDLAEAVKLRMTEVHRQLRRLAPELLPVFADCRAAQLRLLHDLRPRPAEARHEAETALIGALVQIEAATRKLSVVLPETTKEYALGSYADTLEKVTGETLDCLIALRARATGAPRGVQIGGEVDPA